MAMNVKNNAPKKSGVLFINPPFLLKVLHNGIRHLAQYTVESQVVMVTYGKATILVQTRGDLEDHEASLRLHDVFDGNNWQDE